MGQGRALDIILTGRKVTAEECYRIGACERVAPHGRARELAEQLAQEIARFPQACVRSDRMSVYRQHGLPVRKALETEWQTSIGIVTAEGIAGAGRFSAGKAGLHQHPVTWETRACFCNLVKPCCSKNGNTRSSASATGFPVGL